MTRPIDEKRLAQRLGLYETARKIGVPQALIAYEALPHDDKYLTVDEVYATLASLCPDEEPTKAPPGYNLATDEWRKP